jgi:glycyl-tRNA synthetase beta chain
MTRPKTTGHELLLEIGTEELPSHFVTPALIELEERAARLLKAARLDHGTIKTVGTPRRLTLVVTGLADHQEPVATTVMGPSKAVGFDPEGRPTKAAIGFAAAQGVRVEDLEIRATPKGDYVFAVKREAGRKTPALLSDLLSDLVGSLPFPKAMRWNDSGARFARPVRWLLALYGGKPVRFQFAGLTAGNKTVGHRFLSSNKPVPIKDFKSYMNWLEKAGVIVDPERRRAMIASQVEAIAKQKRGLLHRDPSLVEQAVFSVEMPEAIAGAFNPTYLALPKDVLVTAMKEHQGYFSLLARDGKLLPFFVAVANMGGRHVQTIRTGNERVLAARLADAKFFFNEDRKTLLKDRVERLKGVTFHQKLGTLYQKVGRITALASKLADTISEGDLDTVEQCRRAATLCKADLVTGMVGEFPTLQGIMGREYALHDGERQEVADAIAEHYLPRIADDAIPPSLTGRVLSLADRLDTLASFFAVGLVPSGSQDPFALRRHAYAVIRILVEGELSLDLGWALEYAKGLLKDQGIVMEQKAQAELLRFFGERLRYYCMDGDKLRGDLVDAVLAQRQTGTFDPRDVRARAQALQAFSVRAEFESLVVAFKRAENITKGRQDDSVEPALFQEPVEKELHASLMAAEGTVPGFIERADYGSALDTLVVLKAPVDAFFLGVMVMAEDESVRQNRLALLVRVRNLFRRYADFSKVQVEAS